jgi:coiled-coil domain-containing protein 77
MNNSYSDKADMRRKEEHLSILKEQYEKIQEIYLNKIKVLEDHLSKLNDKYNDLTKKSKREAENLRSQLKV